ncbi:hypothetical protein SteCoe_33319 [Stentor coeruleus]|uniref:Uncharacterized protein n=1 Tax=Stentor coeruleus TaxID=5963 RepID=A0A1R2AX31_9CILI|nr:hypothetical protein SteCoe_33319 [Stentor coeruleus]
MGDNFISKLISKIPWPAPPCFTSDSKKDLELIQTFKENLDMYKQSLEYISKNIFTTAVSNSRILQETFKRIEEIKNHAERDISRLNSGFGVKFLIESLGCKKMPQRISKDQLTANYDLIRDSGITYVEDSKQSVFIIRYDSQKIVFPITDCPCCEENNITSKEELITHLKRIHITCKQFSRKKKLEPHKFAIEKINFEDLKYLPSADTIGRLAHDIDDLYHINCSTDKEISLKDKVISYIKIRLETQLPNCELEKYGSSGNGFGQKTSDIDLCLIVDLKSVFKEKKYFKLLSKECGGETTVSDLCELIVFSKICNELGYGSEKVIDLELRESARVRVINFKTPTEPQFEVDICLNNRVAVENTKLLKTYCMIDERVPKLGIAVKVWAKSIDICNPRIGTLSAYAYILLVIYYLQRTNPPILPLLQANAKSNIIDGHECGFDSNYENYIADARKNTSSEGNIFMGFLEFYSLFDWNANTVDIKSKNYVPKLHRNSDFKISIQDPFESNRNLGDVIKSTDAGEKIINSFKSTLSQLQRGKPLFRLLNLNS